jgi:hypothetical protein
VPAKRGGLKSLCPTETTYCYDRQPAEKAAEEKPKTKKENLEALTQN